MLKNKVSQQGATLVVALVMLVVLTLLVISAMRTSTTNLRIAGNMQMQEEASAAAQQAIEQVISNNFTTSPAASSVAVSIGGTTYTATITTPTCLGSTALQNSTPNLPEECISSGAAQNTGIVFASGAAAAGTSWCYAQQWEVQASVTDSNTGAAATVHQGVNLSVPAGTTCNGV
jgi:Tfp pilus assembly protein PilX